LVPAADDAALDDAGAEDAGAEDAALDDAGVDDALLDDEEQPARAHERPSDTASAATPSGLLAGRNQTIAREARWRSD
jgi:hypothetical protein